LLSNQQFLFWFVIGVISTAYRAGAFSSNRPSGGEKRKFNRRG
jgi:hypothetical protein